MQRLRKELANAQTSRKIAAASLRMVMQKAAQIRLMEKEKNKSPSCVMRISLQINKVVWGMLVDGKSFVEAEINGMVSFQRPFVCSTLLLRLKGVPPTKRQKRRIFVPKVVGIDLKWTENKLQNIATQEQT